MLPHSPAARGTEDYMQLYFVLVGRSAPYLFQVRVA
jgi:hypothetical protein